MGRKDWKPASCLMWETLSKKSVSHTGPISIPIRGLRSSRTPPFDRTLCSQKREV
jgi:hypothetical protein